MIIPIVTIGITKAVELFTSGFMLGLTAYTTTNKKSKTVEIEAVSKKHNMIHHIS